MSLEQQRRSSANPHELVQNATFNPRPIKYHNLIGETKQTKQNKTKNKQNKQNKRNKTKDANKPKLIQSYLPANETETAVA
jgi:hypothetical protein